MKRKAILGATLILLALLVTGSIYIRKERSENASLDEIREKFRCYRITTEELATDVYCNNPGLYFEHLRQNRVIGPSDYHRND